MEIWKKLVKIISALFALLVIVFVLLGTYNQAALKQEQGKLLPKGQLVDIEDSQIHVYSEGEKNNAPILVFLSGSGTTAPVYDFKPLYHLLSDDFQIAVVEKPGYGYSDKTDLDRDIERIVEELRAGLKGTKMEGPYILLAHSMSGLEAVYWAQKYPDEVAGIAGLDMAVPNSYDDFGFDEAKNRINLTSLSVKLGLLRIPGIYPLQTASLSEKEIGQQKLLMYKNAANEIYLKEMSFIKQNVEKIKTGRHIDCPMILFSSDGKEIGDFWISAQKNYAKENQVEHIQYDAGHYLHHFKSKEIGGEIKAFVNKVNK
ncbi:MAG: alpha/beta hydrolase [Gallicola sp.]|nr:alpha/beta hydrolase [Gallicola sp.]